MMPFSVLKGYYITGMTFPVVGASRREGCTIVDVGQRNEGENFGRVVRVDPMMM